MGGRRVRSAESGEHGQHGVPAGALDRRVRERSHLAMDGFGGAAGRESETRHQSSRHGPCVRRSRPSRYLGTLSVRGPRRSDADDRSEPRETARYVSLSRCTHCH